MANRAIPNEATVKVKHLRRCFTPSGDSHADENFELMTPYEIKEAGLAPDPRGGRTVVTVRLEDGREATGIAEVSLRDNYCRAIGRVIATGRALKDLGV